MNLIVVDPARDEIAEASDWYNERKSGLGDQFTEAVESTMNELLRDPTSWSVILRNVRRCPVRSFPYDVLFYVEGGDVFVVAVMDQRRRPGYWLDRLDA